MTRRERFALLLTLFAVCWLAADSPALNVMAFAAALLAILVL